jgi:hypothetical protein
MRGIQPGPLATFPKWKELGRFVKKGQKALTLCMPLTCKRTKTVKKDDGTDQEEEFSFTHFTYKAHWFVLAQTDGTQSHSPITPNGQPNPPLSLWRSVLTFVDRQKILGTRRASPRPENTVLTLVDR